MHLSTKQLRLFNRLHRKYPVSLEFLDYNTEKILKFINYSMDLHFTYRCQTIQRKLRIFLRYNVPKKNIFRVRNETNGDKKTHNRNKKFRNNIKKLESLPWAQRVVFYLKKQALLEKIKEKSDNDIEYHAVQTWSSYGDENSLSNCQSIVETDYIAVLPDDDGESKLNEGLMESGMKENENDSKDPLAVDDDQILCDQIANTSSNSLAYATEPNACTDDVIEVDELAANDDEKTADTTMDSDLTQDTTLTAYEELNDEMAEVISNSDSEQHVSEVGDNILSAEQVEEQLKTQLELLKFGKRSLSFLSDKSTEEVKKSESSANESHLNLSTLIDHKRLSVETCKFKSLEHADLLSEDADSTDIALSKLYQSKKVQKSISRGSVENKTNLNESSIIDSFEISEKDALEAGPSSKETNTIATASNNQSSRKPLQIVSDRKIDILPDSHKKGKSIVDSLMSKLNTSADAENKQLKDKPIEKTITVKTVEQINNSASTTKSVYDDNSSSSDDFFGFSAHEIIPPELPGMLPTPAVPKFSVISAFISNDDKQSTVKPFRYTNLPRRYEEGLVCAGRPPPKFEMAALPEEMSKPRTLAEKRIIFSKQRSVKYFMIENENTIYHELKRRTRDGRINTSYVKTVQRSKVPASRDLWKATCWLLTENEKFYFQTIQIDGIQCKLLSGCGNFSSRRLPLQYSSPVKHTNVKRLTDCGVNCLDRRAWQAIRIRYKNPTIKKHISQLKKMNILKNETRPGPLSFKRSLYKDLDGNCKQLEIYKMPKIELEVYPKLNQPLDDYIKSYLKMILPSSSITKEWAEFAVSTLVEYKTLDAAEDVGKMLQTKNSFKFTIPYLNDQTHILVRRVLTRSENYDDKEKLKFQECVEGTSDKVAIECADVLSDMIDSVAIGLSENSFIQNDPDVDYNNETVLKVEKSDVSKPLKEPEDIKYAGAVSDQKQTAGAEIEKKNNKRGRSTKDKLMMELKRLNATIINASDAKVAKAKVCEKEFCRLGCLCSSLGTSHVPKKHCKRVKCMLEKCNCPLTLLEAGNSVITSEDAIILRQKATARLARMEREFTSTVVLTGNETLLINENQTKRKRRNNARLTNYYTRGMEYEDLLPAMSTRARRNQTSTPTSLEGVPNEEEVKQSESPVKEARLPIDIDSLCYIDEDIMKSLKHCSVDLYRLEHLDDKVVWCMVHCLYKCFCNGKDVEGKPFILKKQEEEKVGEIYTRRAKYSFDRSEDENITAEPPKKLIKIETKIDNNRNLLPNRAVSSLDIKLDAKAVETQTKMERLEAMTQEQKRKETRIITAYINNDFYGCHRVQPVPKVYKLRNRRPELRQHWKKFVENEKTAAILNEKIRESETYVRKIIVKRTPTNVQTSNTIGNDASDNSSHIEESTTVNTETQTSANGTPTTSPNSTTKQYSLIKPEIRAKLKSTPQSAESSKRTLPPTKSCSLFETPNAGRAESPSLKIASVMSLNERLPFASLKSEQIASEVQTQPADSSTNRSANIEPMQSLQLNPSSFLEQSSNGDQFALAAEQVQREVMKRLNFSVTKTMHNISKIQSEEKAHIPQPQNDAMITVQWKHVLQYYTEGKFHIWQVKVDQSTYFVATMRPQMPYIANAFGIVNIKAVNERNLPLFILMLTSKFTNSQTHSLSVLLGGHRDYWRILGLTKANHMAKKVGVIRPTTESHPGLTPKINKLFNILTQQYIQTMKRKAMSAPPKQTTPTSIVSLQNSVKRTYPNKVSNSPGIISPRRGTIHLNPKGTAPTTMLVINQNNVSAKSYSVQAKEGFRQLTNANIGNINVQKLDRPTKMNIHIRKLTKEEALTEHFQVPLTSNTGDHRWLVLDLEDDFTHILFGKSMESLTYSKIKQALLRSQAENKMVRFPKVDGHLVDCYIMKFDKKRIYLGPFHESIDPSVLLYQSVDGKLMLREDYEKKNAIMRDKRTTGFWLCRKNGKIMFNLDPQECTNFFPSTAQQKTITTIHNSVATVDTQNPNALIKLTPENVSLIQSQCNNLLITNMDGVQKTQTGQTACVFTSNVNTDAPNLNQIVAEVNKIVKKPCIITSIKETGRSDKKAEPDPAKTSESPAAASVKTSNQSEISLMVEAQTEVEANKTIVLQKNFKDFGIFSSNNLQSKAGKVFLQKNSLTTTMASSGTQVGTINAIQLPIATAKAQKTSESPDKSPTYEAPSFPTKKPYSPKGRTVCPQKFAYQCVQKLQLSTGNTQATTATTTGVKTLNLIPTTYASVGVRPLSFSDLKSMSKQSPETRRKVIGKINEVIISKTSESNRVEQLTDNESSLHQNLPNCKKTVISIVQTADKKAEDASKSTSSNPKDEEISPPSNHKEAEENQHLLKLPDTVKKNILSQKFIVAKKDNGNLVLELGNVSKTSPATNNATESSNKQPTASEIRASIATTATSTNTTTARPTKLLMKNSPTYIIKTSDNVAAKASPVATKPDCVLTSQDVSSVINLKKQNIIEKAVMAKMARSDAAESQIAMLSNSVNLARSLASSTAATATVSSAQNKNESNSLNQNASRKRPAATAERSGSKSSPHTSSPTSAKRHLSGSSALQGLLEGKEPVKNAKTPIFVPRNGASKQPAMSGSQKLNAHLTSLIQATENRRKSSNFIIQARDSNKLLLDPKMAKASSAAGTSSGRILPTLIKLSNPTSAARKSLPPIVKTTSSSSKSAGAAAGSAELLQSTKNKDSRKIYTAQRQSLPSLLPSTSDSKKHSMGAAGAVKSTKSGAADTGSMLKKRLHNSKERIVSTEGLSDSGKGYVSGYFLSHVKAYPKFGGYRKGSDYLIKTNMKTALLLPSINDVSRHLNGFVRKNSTAYENDVRWEFFSFKAYTSNVLNGKAKKGVKDGAKVVATGSTKPTNGHSKKAAATVMAAPITSPSTSTNANDDKNVIVIDDDDEDEDKVAEGKDANVEKTKVVDTSTKDASKNSKSNASDNENEQNKAKLAIN